MLHYTPLRYPGGKRRLAPTIMNILDANGLADFQYAEPFTGGGAVGLGLLYQEYASTIHLNDLNRAVYSVWHTILNETDWLCDRLRRVKVTMEEWKRRRKVYERQDDADMDELGFSALFLNRTNRSGIIGGGVIGGKEQSGKWTLDVRFNKDALIQRIRQIARYRDRVRIYRMDGHAFLTKVVKHLGKSFTFIDPPYVDCDRALYFNTLRLPDHKKLAKAIESLPEPWIVTYDYAAVEASLFPNSRRIVYGIEYVVQEKHRGTEAMFFSDSLTLPKVSAFLGERMKYVPQRSRLNLNL